MDGYGSNLNSEPLLCSFWTLACMVITMIRDLHSCHCYTGRIIDTFGPLYLQAPCYLLLSSFESDLKGLVPGRNTWTAIAVFLTWQTPCNFIALNAPSTGIKLWEQDLRRRVHLRLRSKRNVRLCTNKSTTSDFLAEVAELISSTRPSFMSMCLRIPGVMKKLARKTVHVKITLNATRWTYI